MVYRTRRCNIKVR